MPSIHSVVSTARPVRFQSTVGTRKPGSAVVRSAISEAAAASSRMSSSIAMERARVSTMPMGFRRRESGTSRSAMRAAK